MESVKEKKGLFKRFTSMCVRVMERWLPDPFIFCALLTFIVFIGAIFLTKATPLQVVGFWASSAIASQRRSLPRAVSFLE